MTRREFLVASVSAAVIPNFAFVQKEEDFFTGKDVFADLMNKAKAKNWQKLPMGELVGQVGMSLVDTPYLGQTFEVFDDREVCVINLKGLDCATFYEAALAIARTIKSGRSTESEFRKQVTRIRYRSGRMNGYVSRLHYSSDYFYDNERKGILNIVSDDMPGAEVFPHKVFYMSKNPGQYRQLKANSDLVPQIAKTEADINSRRTFFIPKDKVADVEILLKTGDILGLTTPVNGLDVSHTGICYRDENDVLCFLHASSVKKKIVLDGRLSDYLAHSKGTDGIMVARPLEI